MSTRGIHIVRSLFTTSTESLLLPDQGIITFTHIRANYYKKLTINGTISYINEIIYYPITNMIQINTSAATYNNFFINWAVCLKTVNSRKMPCFSIVVRKEDNSIYTTLPSNSVTKTTVVYGNCILHFPTPDPEIAQVSYFLTLVNTTGADCFFSTKSINVADLMITCIDD